MADLLPVMADLPLSWPAPTGHLLRCCPSWPTCCPSWPTFRCHGRLRPAISTAGPSFLAIFVGLAVIFFRQAIIFGHFCRLSGQFLPPGHHFWPFLTAWRSIFPARPSFLAIFVGLAVIFFRRAIIFGCFCWLVSRHGRLDRPSPACRDAVPSLSRRKRGQSGRWTSQLLLLRPRPSAWPVTSSNKFRPAAFGVTALSPGRRTSPFPPIRSGISAPPPSSADLNARHDRPSVVMAGSDRPSVPPSHHFCHFLLAQRSFSSAGPSFLAIFAGLAVISFRQAVIFVTFCWHRSRYHANKIRAAYGSP